jgi:putative ABC transport system substrate-binding protein
MRTSRLAGVVVLALGPLAAPYAARGQAPGAVPRVGIIHRGGEWHALVERLRQGLRELALEEGKQFVLDIRETQGDLKVVEQVARDLERGKVDLIYTGGTSITTAANRATAQTPIVFFVGTDPVADKLVASFAKPGGRLTGVHVRTTDLTAKRLEILKEIIPRLGRVVIFYNPDYPNSRDSARQGREAARKLSVQLVERHVRSAEELRLGLEALKPREVDAFFQVSDAPVTGQAGLVVDAARARKLPTMFHSIDYVVKGGLAGYGQNFRETGRLSAKHVQRILAGAHPKDLPVESFDKVELAVNLRTAREIGVTIPPSVRIRADMTIE